MEVYDFFERDDLAGLKSKISKQKKRRSKDSSNVKTVTSNKKSRNKRNKLCEDNMHHDVDLHPPIKLKLIRDQVDPHMFKSIQMLSDVSQSSDFSFDIDKNSLLRCKLPDGREFALNDVVWAKISGYPFWPSKILSLNLSTSNQNLAKNSSILKCVSRLVLTEEYIACVEWLAYDQISYVNCINLSHFHSDFINKHSVKIKNKKYFEAVNEAKNLCDENSQKIFDSLGNHNTADSVHSCETTEPDTSSTLPSHNFTSPESNQSVQSYCHDHSFTRSDSLSNQSDRSSHVSFVQDSQNAHMPNIGSSATLTSTNWELPDLGSNLDFESNNHIPEFSDDDDDSENIDIAKIEFLIDEAHKITNG